MWGNYWYEYLGWKGWLGKLIEKMTTMLTDHNLAISSKTLRDYKSISKKPISLLPLGIELSYIQSARPSEEMFEMLFVGRLIKEKNVDSVIRCLSLIDGVRLCIIGDGPERHRLEELARELKVDGSVKFLGFVEDVYSYMKSSRVFVFPSCREGFGLVVIEANACGLPAIVMKHPNNASVDLIEGNGFVCDSEEEMAESVVHLLRDEQLWKEMSKRARVSSEKYDWDILIHQYEEYCINICKQRHA